MSGSHCNCIPNTAGEVVHNIGCAWASVIQKPVGPEAWCTRPHLPDEPSEAAVEVAALTRWVRSEEKRATTPWIEAPAFVQKVYRETALLQLRAAYAAERAQQEGK